MKKKLVIILDYQLGNLFSVQQACDRVGLNAVISSNKDDIEKADAVILPGVGAFGEAMSNMHKLDLVEPLKDFVSESKPLFGVCLGQQLLFTESEEFGTSKGLDFIPGVIKKFPALKGANNLLKVPQIGWNHIYKKSNQWENTPLAGLRENAYVYFVHSYYVEPRDTDNILTLTNYCGIEYCSAVIKKPNIFAAQFHPEKSGELGIGIYERWGKLYNLIDNER
jgi:imidazole glycerol-phosphate synthase subunit HisH